MWPEKEEMTRRGNGRRARPMVSTDKWLSFVLISYATFSPGLATCITGATFNDTSIYLCFWLLLSKLVFKRRYASFNSVFGRNSQK